MSNNKNNNVCKTIDRTEYPGDVRVPVAGNAPLNNNGYDVRFVNINGGKREWLAWHDESGRLCGRAWPRYGDCPDANFLTLRSMLYKQYDKHTIMVRGIEVGRNPVHSAGAKRAKRIVVGEFGSNDQTEKDILQRAVAGIHLEKAINDAICACGPFDQPKFSRAHLDAAEAEADKAVSLLVEGVSRICVADDSGNPNMFAGVPYDPFA